MADENQPKGANTSFPVFSAGDSAGKVLSAGYQNKLSGAVERLSQETFGVGSDVLATGPMSFRKNQKRPHLPAGWIRVQNNYPFRLPKLCAVGVDNPIVSHSITDAKSLERFTDEDTIYSCMAAQARHRNRIAILQQDLMPGEWGYAIFEGLSKAVVHEANPINKYEYNLNLVAPGTLQIEIQSEEQSADAYRHLSVPGANWNTMTGTEASVYVPTDSWGPRFRPKYLFSAGNATAAYYSQLSNVPFSDHSEPPTSKGRVEGTRVWRIPEITTTETATATCTDGAWIITASDCPNGMSGWLGIELGPVMAETSGLTLPCTEATTVSGIPCFEDFPSTDEHYSYPNEYVSGMGGVDGSQYGGNDSFNHNFVIGQVILGSAADSLLSEAARESMSAVDAPCNLQSVFEDSGAAGMLEAIKRCCANLTCTYERDAGGSLVLQRGIEPYRLGQWTDDTIFDNPVDHTADCICPTAVVSNRATKEFANLRMPEITLGMIYSTTTTTSSSTTSSTTTTTGVGACCKFTVTYVEGVGYTDSVYDGCAVISSTECSAYIGSNGQGFGSFHLGEACVDVDCAGSCYACEESKCIAVPNGTSGCALFEAAVGEFAEYSDDECGSRSLSVGACCYFDIYTSCLNTCETKCDYVAGEWFDGVSCSPEGLQSPGDSPCLTSSTTTSTSTTTTTSTTSTTTTTTAPPSTTTTTSSTTTTTAEASSTTTTSSTTTSSAGGSSSTTSSTTTTSIAACNVAPNECTYTCQDVGGYQWVNTSATCTAPCTCDSVPVEGSICGTCDIAHAGSVCSDPSFCT